MTLEEEIEKIHREHRLVTGMQVASGHTCTCGYWNGVEEPGINRPAGYYGLEWHLTQLIEDAKLRNKNTN